MAVNVLVVDDSGVMRKIIMRSLSLGGLPLGDVHEASNGEEALRIAGERHIDLILVDLSMPVMGGEELIQRLRDGATGAIPVVVVSSDGTEARAEQLRGKIAAFVRKPFTPETLRDTVQRVLGGQREPRSD